jgi:hypothetical protein
MAKKGDKHTGSARNRSAKVGDILRASEGCCETMLRSKLLGVIFVAKEMVEGLRGLAGRVHS